MPKPTILAAQATAKVNAAKVAADNARRAKLRKAGVTPILTRAELVALTSR